MIDRYMGYEDRKNELLVLKAMDNAWRLEQEREKYILAYIASGVTPDTAIIKAGTAMAKVKAYNTKQMSIAMTKVEKEITEAEL